MSAPWPWLLPPTLGLAASGVGGLVYGAIVIRRARRQTWYQPMPEDWIWYAILPCSAYAALAVAALVLHRTTLLAVFVIGGAALGLVLIGIRNAWDTVMHIVVTGSDGDVSKAE